MMIDDGQYRVELIDHKNTRMRGSVEIDEDGFATIFVNARQSVNQQLKTVDHELRHLVNDDAYNDVPLEQAERIASGKQPVEPGPPVAKKPTKSVRKPLQAPPNRDPLKTFRKAIEGIRDAKPEAERDPWDYLADVFSRRPEYPFEVKLRGYIMYGLEPDDPVWDRLIWTDLCRDGYPDYSNYDAFGNPLRKKHKPQLLKIIRTLFD